MSFKSCHNGFWLKFDNGITLSTQFSYGNYCDGHEKFFEKCIEDKEGYRKFRDHVPNAEIAVGFGENPLALTGKACKECGISSEDEQVAGYVSFSDWLKVVDWCRKQEASHVK